MSHWLKSLFRASETRWKTTAGRVGDQLHLPMIIATKGDQVLAVHRTIKQRTNLLPFFGLAVKVFERLNPDVSVFFRSDSDIVVHGSHSHEATLGAAAGQVISGNGVGVSIGG